MKPSSGDKKFSIRIEGRELEELQKFTDMMADAFGLDERIENYQGRRPIGLYQWDLDCLADVTASALKNAHEYPSFAGPGFEAMKSLHQRIKMLCERTDAEIE